MARGYNSGFDMWKVDKFFLEAVICCFLVQNSQTLVQNPYKRTTQRGHF